MSAIHDSARIYLYALHPTRDLNTSFYLLA